MTNHQTSIIAQPKFQCPLPSTEADWPAFDEWTEKSHKFIARTTYSYLIGEFSKWSFPCKRNSHDIKSWYSSLPWVGNALQWTNDLLNGRKDPTDVLDASLMANSYCDTINTMGYCHDKYSSECMRILSRGVQELRPALEKSQGNVEKLKFWESQLRDLGYPEGIPSCSRDHEDRFLRWYEERVKEGAFSEE